MRTKEEQISGLSCALFNPHEDIDECMDIARKYILEAERRAEQRVRAEIGRDSERLDWLGNTHSVVLEDTNGGWRVTIGGVEFACMEETARDAIDAAREVGG